MKELEKACSGNMIICDILIVIGWAVLLLALLVPTLVYKSALDDSETTYRFFDKYFITYRNSTALDESCLVFFPSILRYPFRPPVECTDCANIKKIPMIRNISRDDFMKQYAISMHPVVIRDGQTGWTAAENIDFGFVKRTFGEGSKTLDWSKKCDFFSYHANINNIQDALAMIDKQAAGKGNPWHAEWHICDLWTANFFRQYYKLPYFLPRELQHSRTDWLFLGTPGHKSYSRIHNVTTISWQAQLKGKRKWLFRSPPECVGVCATRMQIITEPGDVIVFDSTKWIHETSVVGDESSVAIGSDYF